jgi:ATP-dependent helicase/nuclease subunit B
MGVRFIIGRAGSGKTSRCFRAITDQLRGNPLGDPIYLIVPKQETFTAERTLTCASNLPGFCRAHVVSFELLGEEILAECGGAAIPQVTELGRQMVIGHLLRKHEKQLTHYASTARQTGLAAELDGVFSEIERCGKTVSDLADAAQKIESPSLAAKLADLHLLYQQYSAYLGQDRLDPHRRLAQVLQSVADCKHIKNATIYVDGFLEFTDHERRMLAGLAKVCREMEITLLLDPQSRILENVHALPEELNPFYRTEDTYRRLWFAFNEENVASEYETLPNISRFESTSLKQIEANLFSPKNFSAVENVELIETPDRRSEVDTAARKIRELLNSRLRFRDIAVLMRDLNEYHELIDASFKEHAIPYFADRRRTAMHHPLIQFIRAVFQIALHNWPHDAVMTLLKTGLASLSRDEIDELENYVLLHRIRGQIWTDENPWNFRRKLTRNEEDDWSPQVEMETKRIDELRRAIAQKIQPLNSLFAKKQPTSLRQIVIELFNLFERFNIRATLKTWIDAANEANQLERGGEHEQVWTELVALLDQMVDILGEERVSAEDFVNILETGLERFDLALTPPTVDQVLVGSVDRTRSARPKAVILLGMNENQFPRAPREGSVFSDDERRTLSENRVDLDPDCQRMLLDERLLGYIAFTRASNYLFLTRSLADEESRPQSPSQFWISLQRLFLSLKPIQISREISPENIGTPRQLVTALMNWVRRDDPAPNSPWPSLYQWLATHDCCNDAIDTMRFRAWRALSYANQATLAAETSAKLFQSPLRTSVSRIETFAACPFKHFVRYGLRLSEREDEDVTAIDLGNVCHSILEKIVRQMLKENANWAIGAKTDAAIHALAAEIGQELRGELMLSTARNRYLLERIEKTLGQVIAAQTAAAKHGRLKPWRAELIFDEGAELQPLKIKTPNGNQLVLRGKIDRVDLIEDQAAFAVIDYKLTGNKLALDQVYHGLSLQLLTYLLVLQNNGEKLAGKKLTPVAAFYVKLLRQLEKVDHPDDATAPDDPLFDLRVKPRGIIDWKHRKLVDSQHTSKASEVVQLYVKSDGTLGNRNNSDGCDSSEFSAMLDLVQRKLGELADRMLSGDITISPYRINQTSACMRCEYRCVCRFDVTVNRYHQLVPMKREDVLSRVMKERGDGA